MTYKHVEMLRLRCATLSMTQRRGLRAPDRVILSVAKYLIPKTPCRTSLVNVNDVGLLYHGAASSDLTRPHDWASTLVAASEGTTGCQTGLRPPKPLVNSTKLPPSISTAQMSLVRELKAILMLLGAQVGVVIQLLSLTHPWGRRSAGESPQVAG